MSIRDIIPKIKNLNEKLIADMGERSEKNRQIWAETEDTAKSYLDDVKLKEDKVKEHIRELELKKQETTAAIKSMQPQLVDATASGNEKDFKKIQGQITELKANEQAISEQIEMLQSANVNGNAELYRLVSEKHERLITDSGDYSTLWDEINRFATKQISFWESIERETSSSVGPILTSRRHGKTSAIAQKVVNHYSKCHESGLTNPENNASAMTEQKIVGRNLETGSLKHHEF